MRAVEHDGERYLLVEASEASSLVRDPATGEERHLPNDELTVVDDSPFRFAARAIPEAPRRVLTAVHSEQALGVLVELDERGPLAVRELLDRDDLCESDLHGVTSELRVAGLLEEADVDGERGYAATDLASEGLEALR